ncbi:MAG: GNAT family N-acetyltransferase [Anaerolineaceae bacterium]|nr:GNAT family N-acetyltransferase [Anaerolineaceae bacterium]
MREQPGRKIKILVESERLMIRRPEDGDIRSLEGIFCDAGMMRYLGGPWDQGKTLDALREWRDDWGINNSWYGVLLKKDTMQAIGTAGFSNNSIPNEPGLELSWFVGTEYQGIGYATEITSELLSFAFIDLSVKRVLAETHPENPASNRVLEKMGFKCLGERQHIYDYLPGFNTQVLWELTQQDWERGKR